MFGTQLGFYKILVINKMTKLPNIFANDSKIEKDTKGMVTHGSDDLSAH